MKEKKPTQFIRPLINKPKQYQLDSAMKLAAKRSSIQPELISMNSNIRIWEERGT